MKYFRVEDAGLQYIRGKKMTYKENPKTKGSGIMCVIPQEGTCPNGCEDCFFQSGRSFLEPLEENLPNMLDIEPGHMEVWNRVIRVNDGNDSNVNPELVRKETTRFPQRFYNTSMPFNLEDFDRPVVLTINPGIYTDDQWFRLRHIPKNLMFVRIRTNLWNLEEVVIPAIEYYTERDVPVVLTFMAYFDTADKIPKLHRDHYIFRKRTTNSYFAITTSAWDEVMRLFKYNKWVHSCGKIEGERGDTHCRFCGNCLREYFATMERLR